MKKRGEKMKENLFIKITATLLTLCILLSSVTAVQIVRVYASEEENYTEEGDGGGDYQEPEPEYDMQSESEPESEPEPAPEPEQPDPFDYELVCYTPEIGFGTVYAGDIVQAKQFSVVNVGTTTFPITYEEIDQYTAFDCGRITENQYLNPNESAVFSVSPREGLKPGKYTATYTFFSANDIRRHHTARVDVSVTVKDAAPYVTSVEVVPGAATIPTGKSYQFQAIVTGGNGFSDKVTWSIAGNQSTGTVIDANGKLTVASNELATSFAVIATSRQDTSFADMSVVTVTSVDHIVSVKADPTDGGAVAGGGAVKDGGAMNISASPNNNFEFKGWYEGGNLVSNSSSFTVNNVSEDRNFVAKFERKTCYVKTSVNDGDAGSVTKSATVSYGGKMTITAKANSGYKFEGFAENKKTISTASSLELNNITEDRHITAVFSRDTCRVDVSVSPQDTGKYEGAGKYNKGSKVELRAKAYDGYEFAGWSINGQIVSKDAKYTIEKIKNDVNVVANFIKKNATTYKLVSGIATSGGSIVPSGDYVVQEGGSVTYNIVPQADYKITSVIIDGKNIGAVSSYTFNNVKGGHTITAAFEKKPQAAPASSSSSGKSSSQNASKSVTKKETAPKKTEYNKSTAEEGALPEQNVVDVKTPEGEDEFDEEEYGEDIYTEASEIVEEPVPQFAGSVMAKHDLDEATLRVLINDDAVLPMLREAFEDGTLKITVNNSYAADTQETAVELYYQKPTLINFEDVIAETLSSEEKFNVLTGTPIAFNIDITENTDEVDKDTKELMQKKVGYKPVSYFDFRIMKTSAGTTSVIDKTSAELEVVVPIPEEFQKDGRKFFVIRNHNGKVDVLEDIGSDPTTVTFRTDRFSEYAIAYEAVNINKLILRVIIIMTVALILAVICFFNLVKYRRKARIAAKRNNAMR